MPPIALAQILRIEDRLFPYNWHYLYDPTEMSIKIKIKVNEGDFRTLFNNFGIFFSYIEKEGQHC